MSDTIIDRRDFVVGAAAAAVAMYVPCALGAAAPATGGPTPRATLADWHVDDMWGVYPRPSEPIGYGRPHGDGEIVAAVQPADWLFVA